MKDLFSQHLHGRVSRTVEPMSSVRAPLSDCDLMLPTSLSSTESGRESALEIRPLLDATPAWLEGGTAILNDRGVIERMNEPLRSWMESSAQWRADRSFWEELKRSRPDLEERVDAMLHGRDTFGTLTFAAPTQAEVPARWFRLESTRVSEGWVIRLGSILPPAQELAESTWDAHLCSESARRDMFIRLLRAETQLDNLMHRWPGVIFSQRADLSFRFVSPSIAELTGLGPADWQRQGQPFWHLVHEADVEELQQQLKRAVRTGGAMTTTYRIRHSVTGRIAYILEHRQPTLSPGGLLLGYDGVWLDVTRQTIAERRLSTAAWKETLAVLTLGMAHDFGNIMAGIHSLAESFLAQVDRHHPFHEGLVLIKKNALQASQLVNRMVNLHLGQTGERGYYNLNETVGDIVELVRKILPRRIQITTELSQESLPLYVDIVEFRQVVINLTLNAADAMPKGGTLLLKTSIAYEAPVLTHFKGIRPRVPAVCLAVLDTGCGIKPRHLATIFDPFFTTKATHKGSGLGLYNAALFAEKHQGCIGVESTEGVGSTLTVWLPQADFSEAERLKHPSMPTAPRRRTILLAGRAGEMVERRAELLRSHSYYVVVATSPESVADFLQSPDYAFDGVLLAVELRDATFHALAAEIRPPSAKGIKLILEPIGCEPEAFDQQLLSRADLVVDRDLPETEAMSKLNALFSANP